MTTTTDAVKFLKKGIKTTDGKYFPCWYSLTKLIDGRVAVTIYARSLLKGLPAELSPINESASATAVRMVRYMCLSLINRTPAHCPSPPPAVARDEIPWANFTLRAKS